MFVTRAGDRYGRLIVVRKEQSGKNWLARWLCLCDCGREKIIFQASLRSGQTQSCGCLQKERASAAAWKHTKHGESDGINVTSEYHAWTSMIQRCHNPSHKSYDNYGGRGIKVCRAWLNSYETFLKDVGRKPSKQHSLNRINNDKGYSPVNVRWDDWKTQNRNTRKTTKLSVNGVTKTVLEWAELLKVPYSRLQSRIRLGWPSDKIVSLPKMKPHKGSPIGIKRK